MTESNPDSILDSTKKKLGLTSDYDVFDEDIISHINTVFFNLHQLGVGPTSGFEIESADAVWTDFLPKSIILNASKSYVYVKVRLLFDPPSTSFNLTSLEEVAKELEWRINTMREEMNPLVVVQEPTDGTDPGIVGPIFADVDGGGADLE